MNNTTILLCKCRSEHFKTISSDEIEEHLSTLDINLLVVDDLCATVLTDADELNSLKNNSQSIIVLACQPRAVKHLLIQNAIEWNNFSVINYRDNGFQRTLEELKPLNYKPGIAKKKTLTSKLDVPSWFPVVDQERCTACGRCAKFCLFGVYIFKDKQLKVQQPLNCKNNCPACARTCPAAAIMFPKIAEGGVISGAETQEQKVILAPVSLTSRLTDRQNLRNSILKPSVVEQAEKERAAARNKTQN